jgi:protein subunit release factor B
MKFPVSSEKEESLLARMASLGIREEDIDEKFIRSQGAGGQNVNKLSTCVVLLHRPSGIQIKCQQERSQGLNRFLARRLLADKVEEKEKGVVLARQKEIHKIRKQKKKRSRRVQLKLRVLKEKRQEKKDSRRSLKNSLE